MRLIGTAGLCTLSLTLGACHSPTEVPEQSPLRTPILVTAPGPIPQAGTGPGPTPSPTPTPAPTPTPTPEPTPTPGTPVVKVTIGVMFVVCDNEGVPNSAGARRVPVGCKVHMDLTPKGADNKPTTPNGLPEWRYSNPRLIDVREDTYTPILIVKDQGDLTVTASVDGVQSNEYNLHFYYR